MKRICCALLVFVLLSSCSKDETDENITYVDATVAGTLHMFNTFYSEKETIVQNGNPVAIVSLAASIERQPSIVMGFKFYQGQLGFDACQYVSYIEDGAVYERFDDSFTIEVVESTQSRIRGVFSGNLKNLSTGEVVAVSTGGFDIFYNIIIP